MLKKFEEFEIPDDCVLQCYMRKYKTYDKENIPFIEYSPTEEELLVNERICEQKTREKEAAKAEATRRRQEKRKENQARRNRANDDEENPEEVQEQVPEEVPEEFVHDILDDLIEELAGPGAELDAIVGGFLEQNQADDEIILEEVPQPRSRSRRIRRPARKVRDQYEF